jgi:[ribosomal protein S18]-alanine N-acetyltransferase
MTTEQISIRRLGYADLPQVIAIERRSFPTPWSLAMFVLELSKPSGVCLAAVQRDDDGSRGDGGPRSGERRRGREQLLGYLVCSRYDEVWHLMNIAVDPIVRRRGLGSRLLDAMLERAGADSAYTLEVRTSNMPAIALYERYGFRSAGTRPRYYQDTGEDAMIMWRTTDAQSSTLAGGGAPT